MDFKNTTVFIAPVCYNEFSGFAGELLSDERWEETEAKSFSPDYLLTYAHSLFNDPKRFRVFRFKNPNNPEICVFNENGAEISEIRLSCFGTGIGFAEFFVRYDENMSVEDIANFSYLFKKAAKADSRSAKEKGWKGISLDKAIADILPKKAEYRAFFTNTASFKRECYCFHAIKTLPEEMTAEHLELLKRSYNTNFGLSETSAEDRFNMTYKPYPYDFWGGSPEAFANLCYAPENESAAMFINTYKYDQLMKDYHLCYLLLLNQRFSTVRLIQEIALVENPTAKQMQKINEAVVKLKTSYAFRVISDDRIYQDVYSRMYDILDIDNLMADVQDSEAQLSMVRDMNALRAEKDTSRFLFAISILSLFSALTDAASYFERFNFLVPLSTALSFGCVAAIVVLSGIWIFRRR